MNNLNDNLSEQVFETFYEIIPDAFLSVWDILKISSVEIERETVTDHSKYHIVIYWILEGGQTAPNKLYYKKSIGDENSARLILIMLLSKLDKIRIKHSVK